jgi:hypothetical protein
MNQEKYRKKIMISYFMLATIILSSALFSGCSDKNKEADQNEKAVIQKNDQDFSENESGEGEEVLTPEEVIARLDREEGIGVKQGPIEVEIISPEGEFFVPSQARHYQAEIEGIETGSRCRCDWKFYLNENNEEVLYKEMADRQCSSKEDSQNKFCGFTTTFIDKIGELRVEVEVEVEKQKKIVENGIAERTYIVK